MTLYADRRGFKPAPETAVPVTPKPRRAGTLSLRREGAAPPSILGGLAELGRRTLPQDTPDGR